MPKGAKSQEDALSVIIPANNEAGYIGACLSALSASELTANAPFRLEAIVVSNASTDATVAIAHSHEAAFDARGWTLKIIDLEKPGKPNALNAGDHAASYANRMYLDADVVLTPDLIAKLMQELRGAAPVYASGRPNIPRPQSLFSGFYARFYARVPFMSQGVPGCGLFAVNRTGRARWGHFPDIISDDTFVRLLFRPEERKIVDADYAWPVVEGFGPLVRVRRRQDKGVAEIRAHFPELPANDDRRPPVTSWLPWVALARPLSFAAYALVAVVVRLTPGAAAWSRGR